MREIVVVGGGLAGCEASYQLLKRGYKVRLYEMRKSKMTPCHSTVALAELVCSNSLKSMDDSTASGTLKKELEQLDCLLLKCAYKMRVPSGSALAVNRDLFSQEVENVLNSYENFTRIDEEYIDIDINTPTIIASGPLTSDSLADNISQLIEDEKSLHFYDAVAPIVSADSLDYDKVFCATRYNKGNAEDYLNCGMDREEYERFYEALVKAKCAELHDFDKREIFDGCMPIEIMAKRGAETLRYGMMKPVGIVNPVNDKRYYAVVQLRKENIEGTMYNLVGFQTNLTFSEQKRVFSMIPGLENAEFLRYGVMHRNTFLNAPKLLEPTFKLKGYENIYFAGQITGVEGYVESIMSGLIASINLHRSLCNESTYIPPVTTITGALMRHISTYNENYQPMNANFGILPPFEEKIRDKKLRKSMYAKRAICDIIAYNENINFKQQGEL